MPFTAAIGNVGTLRQEPIMVQDKEKTVMIRGGKSKGKELAPIVQKVDKKVDLYWIDGHTLGMYKEWLEQHGIELTHIAEIFEMKLEPLKTMDLLAKEKEKNQIPLLDEKCTRLGNVSSLPPSSQKKEDKRREMSSS